jgi:flavin-dependent dehydrogenase
MSDVIRIAGAGVSGLTAAIALARAGVSVEVHERCGEVGMRFYGDIQGISNWMSDGDILDWLATAGLQLDCPWHRPDRMTFFDAARREYVVALPNPPLVMVRRGPFANSLDQALKRQALAAGVRIHFNSWINENDPSVHIAATGPHKATAIALGYTFATRAAPELCVIFDDAVAPKGYAYLAIAMGRGCVGAVLFSAMGQARACRARAMDAFRRLRRFDMADVKPYSGYGEAGRPRSSGDKPFVGEAGGLQDELWGFGIRFAMESGRLAAQSILEGRPYWPLVERHLQPIVRRSRWNRRLFNLLGNEGYALLADRLRASSDAREFVRALYKPGLRGLLETIARGLVPARAPHASGPQRRSQGTERS